MSDGKTYEMMWDCGACGTPKLLAKSHKHCPTCGSPQDPSWRYFPPEDEKVAVEDHVFMGKDKVCAACSTPNAAQAKFCAGCGCDLDDAKEAQTRSDQLAEEGQSFAQDDADAAAAEAKARRKAEREAKMAAQAPPGYSSGSEEPKSKKGLILGALGGTAFVLFLICVGVFFFWKKDATLVNTGHTWERTIQIEQMKTVSESALDDEVPRAAKQVSCKKQKRSTKKVADGQTCKTRRKDNGDGTYSEKEECKTKYREEPVYGQKCSYKIDKWVNSRVAKASGKGLSKQPYWPKTNLKRTGNCLGCERESTKHETYTLTFKDSESKKSKSCNVNQKLWTKVKPKTKWIGQIGVVSGSLDCSDLKPAK